MDKVQKMVKNKLGLTDMQVEAYKAIYDFISRFAGVQQASWNQDITLYGLERVKLQDKSGTLHNIPPKTYQILLEIGTANLYKYYSPLAYEGYFLFFVKKIRAREIRYSDYITDGLIVFAEKQESSYEVEEIDYEDNTLFGGAA